MWVYSKRDTSDTYRLVVCSQLAGVLWLMFHYIRGTWILMRWPDGLDLCIRLSQAQCINVMPWQAQILLPRSWGKLYQHDTLTRTNTSSQELGKIVNFLCPHCLREYKLQMFYQLVGFECPTTYDCPHHSSYIYFLEKWWFIGP